MVKILGLAGSLRQRSNSKMVLDLAIDRAKKHGVPVEVMDLRQLDLPFCDGSESYEDHPDVERLREAVREAEGLILVTPEYHGSISGVLKNALDLLAFEHLEGTVVAPISVLGGGQSHNALNTLRVICRQLHAWVLPQQLAIPFADRAINQDGQLAEAVQSERLDQLVRALVENTRKLK